MTGKPLGEVFRDSRAVSRFWADDDPQRILSAELGPAFDGYRRLWDSARSFRTVPPFPLHVDYELKRACDLRCPMCPMGLRPRRAAGAAPADGPEGPEAPGRPPDSAESEGWDGSEGAERSEGSVVREGVASRTDGAKRAAGPPAAGDGSAPTAAGPELAPGLVEDLIDQGIAAGQASMGFGGMWEPLTSPHVPGLVAHGRSRGLIEAMFNTNGLRLVPDVARDLMEAGLTRIMISLDAATEATYDRMRPGSDFRRVKDNVLELLAARARARRRLPLVRLSFCLTSVNEAELEAFTDEWRGRVDFFSIQRFGNYSEGGSALFPRLGTTGPPEGRCAQPFKRMMIRHDGMALPCCDLSGLDLVLGDVRRTPLAAIWEGEAIGSLRRSLMAGGDALRPDCRRCQGKFLPGETERTEG